MERIGIFIDGAYLGKVLKESFSSPAINFSEFSKLLANGGPILRTYYYNCLPYKRMKSSPEEQMRYSSMQRFITSLEKHDRYEVRLGKLAYRGKRENGTPIFQQKRVDILLACDLVLLASKQKIGKAIIITGDSDFIPAIQIAKNEGVEIELVYGADHHPHESLFQIADIRRVITEADINRVTMPKEQTW